MYPHVKGKKSNFLVPMCLNPSSFATVKKLALITDTHSEMSFLDISFIMISFSKYQFYESRQYNTFSYKLLSTETLTYRLLRQLEFLHLHIILSTNLLQITTKP